MRQIVEWGVPAELSGRLYHRGCINLPDLNLPVDIVLINNDNQSKSIGESYLIENEHGIFIKEVKWNVDVNYLDELIDEQYQKNSNTVNKYDPELCIGMMGSNRPEYKVDNELEFKFLIKTILSDEPIESLIRDIKLNSITL